MVPGLRGRFRNAPIVQSSPLFLAVSINAFGAGMFFPFALIYYQSATSLTVSTIGVALTAATVITLSINPVTGVLVDRWGAKPMVVASQCVEAAGFAAYLAVSSSISLFAAALIATAGTRMFYASFSTLIAESVAGAERDRWYGFVGITQNIGASLSGVLASLLLGSLGPGGFRFIIIFNICCLLVSGVLIQFKHATRISSSDEREPGDYRTVLRDRVFLKVVGSNMLFILCSMLLGLSIAVYTTEALNAPLWTVGLVGIVQTSLLIGMQAWVVRRISTFRRTRSMIAAGGTWVVACLVFAVGGLVPSAVIVPYIMLAVATFTIAQLLYIPASRALAAELSPESSRGRYIATYELSWGCAAAIGPALFGLTYDVVPWLPWLSMSGLVLAGIVLLRIVEQRIPDERNYPARPVLTPLRSAS